MVDKKPPPQCHWGGGFIPADYCRLALDKTLLVGLGDGVGGIIDA